MPAHPDQLPASDREQAAIDHVANELRRPRDQAKSTCLSAIVRAGAYELEPTEFTPTHVQLPSFDTLASIIPGSVRAAIDFASGPQRTMVALVNRDTGQVISIHPVDHTGSGHGRANIYFNTRDVPPGTNLELRNLELDEPLPLPAPNPSGRTLAWANLPGGERRYQVYDELDPISEDVMDRIVNGWQRGPLSMESVVSTPREPGPSIFDQWYQQETTPIDAAASGGITRATMAEAMEVMRRATNTYRYTNQQRYTHSVGDELRQRYGRPLTSPAPPPEPQPDGLHNAQRSLLAPPVVEAKETEPIPDSPASNSPETPMEPNSCQGYPDYRFESEALLDGTRVVTVSGPRGPLSFQARQEGDAWHWYEVQENGQPNPKRLKLEKGPAAPAAPPVIPTMVPPKRSLML